jgi:uncharacterized protein YukE
VADWDFPGLGFDPLPGNPQVATDLGNDARIFGQRMTDQATELRKLAYRDGWQGQAADVFAQHLRTLPVDLERCGEAFTGLADALATYAAAFDVAKRTSAADLERRAVEARQKLQAADTALHTPVISAPGDCPPAPDHKPLDDAQDELGAILREAHNLADTFNDSADVQHLEHVIRKVLTHYAPDEPGWNVLKHWAGEVFKLAAATSPLGLAMFGAHELINRYPEFFNHVAGVLSELSGVVGLVGLPLMFFPPLGTAVAAGVLALTAASAAIKTSLYVGDARDANGNLIVTGWSLVHSYADVAMSAGAIGAAAGAARTEELALGNETTFARQLGRQFNKKVFDEDLAKETAKTAKLLAKGGPKLAAKKLFEGGVAPFAEGAHGRALNWGGVVVGGVGPSANARDASNVFGWRSVQHIAPETKELFRQESDVPDLQLKIGPIMTAAGHPNAAFSDFKQAAPQPIMDD